MSVYSQAPLDIVIMAAGKGTRMNSQVPKVLQRLAGRPLLAHVLDLAQSLEPRSCTVVLGHGYEQVKSWYSTVNSSFSPLIQWVIQEQQLGTGHAVQQAMPVIPNDEGYVLVLSADVPLTSKETLQHLIDTCASDTALGLLTVRLQDPSGYGRIVRSADQASVEAIIEEKDANQEQKKIQEVYSGMMYVKTSQLRGWLSRLQNNNAQQEYYLTDVVRHAVADHYQVKAYSIKDELEVLGVNIPAQLAFLERAYQLKQAQYLMAKGVRLSDPSRIDVRGTIQVEQDVEIDVNCIFEGQVILEKGVRIGPHCVIRDAHIHAGACIQAMTHIDGGGKMIAVGHDAQVGPFSRLRPGTQLGAHVHIGNFVELKNTVMDDGAKANHLAYLGDAQVGKRVNYGAGSITANYDGANKHRTVIEDDVHVGSNCVLVAPVEIKKQGTVGAGSVVTQNTPEAALTVARAKPMSFLNWKRPQKKSPSSS